MHKKYGMSIQKFFLRKKYVMNVCNKYVKYLRKKSNITTFGSKKVQTKRGHSKSLTEIKVQQHES